MAKSGGKKGRGALVPLQSDGAGQPFFAQERVRRWLAEALGLGDLLSTPAASHAQRSFPDPKLDKDALGRLESALGEAQVAADLPTRGDYAGGHSLGELLETRAGVLTHAPDAVVFPKSPIDVLEVIQHAEEMGFAVVPVGGRTGRAGGVAPVADKGRGVVALDLARMDRLLGVDEMALTAVAEAGITSMALEEALKEKGFTLGHHSAGLEDASLGAIVATGGAGERYGRYGGVRDWLTGAKLASPRGLWTAEAPGPAAMGPDMLGLVVGSEGTLGIVTEATMRIRPLPEESVMEALEFPSLESALTALRELMQAEVRPAGVSLAGPETTRVLEGLVAAEAPRRRRLFALGGSHGPAPETVAELPEKGRVPCRAVVRLEGGKDLVHYLGQETARAAKRYEGRRLSPKAGVTWRDAERRFLKERLDLIAHGLGVGIVDTWTRWSNVVHLTRELRRVAEDAMGRTIQKPGARGLVLARVTQAHRDGAAIELTMIFPRTIDGEAEQWGDIRGAVIEAALEQGGLLSSHSGIGQDNQPWLVEEKGALGLEVLAAAKRALDPANVLNPGKLFSAMDLRRGL